MCGHFIRREITEYLIRQCVLCAESVRSTCLESGPSGWGEVGILEFETEVFKRLGIPTNNFL